MPHASNGARLVSPAGENLPLRAVVITSEAGGGIARTTLRQDFKNPYPGPLDLTYAFPLPADGAVAGYEMKAGDRLIKGRVERRDEARTHYEAARLEGRTAALVDQERPNLFTQHLGNIPASTDVTVELTVDHPMAWVSGVGWEWRFPTVAAPRYLGAPGDVPDASRVTLDVATAAMNPTASLSLAIADDLSTAPTSPSHSILVADQTVTLTGLAPLDRDIVIRWAAGDRTPRVTLRTKRRAATTEPDDQPAYGLLSIVPPVAGSGPRLARDLILLLDVSGSMDGRPLETLKEVVVTLIDSLTDDDRVEMIAFSSKQVKYRREPVQATEAERRKATTWIDALGAGGGTELIPAIGEALGPLRAHVPRQVVVVTDGLIGFEAAAVRAIRDGLPRDSRLHTVGIGSASNQAFLGPAARAGRGVEVLIGLDEPAAQGAARVAAATREPVVVDVGVHGTAVAGDAPRLPDLLSGSPVVAPVRLRPEGGTLLVRGRTAEGAWEQRLDVPPVSSEEGSNAIPALWARETIEDLELDLSCGGKRAAIDRRIEEIALQHSVSSRLTSWVAIAEERSVDPREPVRTERIPQALPYGISAEGVGLSSTGSAIPRMLLGESTFVSPEPSSFLSFESPLDVEPDRDVAELRRSFEPSRSVAARQIDRLKQLIGAIEESFQLVASRALSTLPRRGLESRLHALLARLRDIESAEVTDARMDELRADARRLFEAIERYLQQSPAWTAELRGHVVATPDRPTTTIEIGVTTAFDWRPARTATIADRSVAIVETGTTRPGPVMDGSHVRVELAVAPEEVLQSGYVKIISSDGVVVIAIDSID